MGHLERGEKNVSFSSIVKVANALGVPLSKMFDGLETASGTPVARLRPVSKPELNRQMLAKEVAVLERTVQKLKDLAMPQQSKHAGPQKLKP
jgi:hypothetical protein